MKSKGSYIDGVIHLAGIKAVSESVNYPLKYLENNLIGSLNLFKSISENNCNTIIFSSSSKAFSNAKNDFKYLFL